MNVLVKVMILVYFVNCNVHGFDSRKDLIDEIIQNKVEFEEICIKDLEKFNHNELSIVEGEFKKYCNIFILF